MLLMMRTHRRKHHSRRTNPLNLLIHPQHHRLHVGSIHPVEDNHPRHTTTAQTAQPQRPLTQPPHRASAIQHIHDGPRIQLPRHQTASPQNLIIRMRRHNHQPIKTSANDTRHTSIKHMDLPQTEQIETEAERRRRPGRPTGRPGAILRGYHPETDNWEERWDPDTPAGKVVLAIRASATRRAAATWAGISEGTLYDWIQKGRDYIDDPRPPKKIVPYVHFLEAISRAEAANEVDLVMMWKNHVSSDWRAARDLLARRHPDTWGPKEKVEHSGGVEHTFEPGALTRRLLANPSAMEKALEAFDMVAEDS